MMISNLPKIVSILCTRPVLAELVLNQRKTSHAQHKLYQKSRSSQLSSCSTTTASRTLTTLEYKNIKRQLRKDKESAITINSASGENDDFEVDMDSKLEVIKELFYLSEDTRAEALLIKNPKLKFIHSKTLFERREFFLEKGMPIKRFLKMPWVFTIPKNILRERVGSVQFVLRMDDFLATLSFLNVPFQRLLQIGTVWKTDSTHMRPNEHQIAFKHRVDYLAHHLLSEQFEVTDAMLKVPVLVSGSFPRIKEKLHLLLDNQIQPKDIVKDPYIFSSNVIAIETRLAMCKKNGLGIVKPWMIRCMQEAYESYVDRLNQEQELLDGHKDIKSFLTKRLGCNAALVEDILFRVPSVKTASASKLNEMIEFLYAQGFTTDHILETPRILGHSVETVDERISQLASYGFTPNSLNILCHTTKLYNAFIRRLGKEAATVSDE